MRRTETWAEALAGHLARRIATGELAPGSALDESRIAAEHGVSRTPVREALRQLTALGLTEAAPRRGILVACPAPARLAEMFAVLAELEALTAALAAARMSAAEHNALEAAQLAMAPLVHAGDAVGYRAANLHYHALIAEGARNAYLRELAAGTRQRLAAFRGARFDSADGMRRSHLEHGGILAAILAGDEAGAAAMMRQHILRTGAALQEEATRECSSLKF